MIENEKTITQSDCIEFLKLNTDTVYWDYTDNLDNKIEELYCDGKDFSELTDELLYYVEECISSDTFDRCVDFVKSGLGQDCDYTQVNFYELLDYYNYDCNIGQLLQQSTVRFDIVNKKHEFCDEWDDCVEKFCKDNPGLVDVNDLQNSVDNSCGYITHFKIPCKRRGDTFIGLLDRQQFDLGGKNAVLHDGTFGSGGTDFQTHGTHIVNVDGTGDWEIWMNNGSRGIDSVYGFCDSFYN